MTIELNLLLIPVRLSCGTVYFSFHGGSKSVDETLVCDH